MVSAEQILNASILVVDDQEVNVALLQQMLHGAGYRSVTSTRNPHEVCELQRQHRYNLILLDLQMPGMNGFQVLDALKATTKDDYVPVLVITAQPAHKLRALQNGARDFISKPFDVAEVLIRVRNMLEVRLLHEACRSHGEEQESLALTDALTGLANRRLVVDRLTVALAHARREQGSMAVLYLDLDGFKDINTTLGHGSGDALLKMVAGRLEATVREEDTVARLGGDEFVIVLHSLSAAAAAQVATKVIEAVSQPYLVEGHPAHEKRRPRAL
jgi:two-component system cell cycle response regulator